MEEKATMRLGRHTKGPVGIPLRVLFFLILPVVLAAGLLSSGCTSLVNRMAFFPDTTHVLGTNQLPALVREVWVPTEDKQQLQCYLVRVEDSRNLLIYFPGNAGNVCQRVPELLRFAQARVSVLGVGYRGYGRSSGKPSEQGLYADGRAALKVASGTLGYKPDHIFICGRSLGSTVAISSAQSQSFAGLILVTPISTGNEYARAHGLGVLSLLSGNAFDNLSKCAAIQCPVLILHGTDDEVAPYEMGKKMAERMSRPTQFVTIQGGHHNTLELQDPATFWGAIEHFITTEGAMQTTGRE